MHSDDLPPVPTADDVAALLELNADYVRKLARGRNPIPFPLAALRVWWA